VGREAAAADFFVRFDAERSAVEDRLRSLVDALAGEHAGIHEAIVYCLLGGGKRLRPTLCLWSHDLARGQRRDAALDAACAVECVHTYSLIHDDLPCMDDDDLRRGQPSAHRKFDEATAVLTGDALLTLGFQILVTLPARSPDATAQDALAAASALASVAGTGGLIAGQALDLSSSGGTGDLDAVRSIHRNKTARLIAAAMEIGAIWGGAEDAMREKIRLSGLRAGEAFQIVDDVLDCTKDSETLGKTPGKDAAAGKLTYPAVCGLEDASRDASRLTGEAKRLLLECEGVDVAAAGRLTRMFDFLVERGA
jgi:geranylgeranyl pyrophosphate synthase